MKKVKLGEVCEILSGYAFKSSQFNDKKIGLPLIRIRDVERGFSDTYFEGDFPKEYLIHRGDLLITMDGSFIMKKWGGDLALLNQRVCKLRITDENVDEGYLSWMIPKFLKEIEDKTPFVTVKHLSVAKIKNISFFLPDIQEQKIISKKLDTIRQIYNFRKKQSEKYNELVKSRFNEMFILSDFSLKRLGELVDEVRYGTSLPATINGKYGYLRMNNITENGKLNIQNLKHIDIPEKDLEKYVVRKGDVLFNRTNSIELVGKTCIYELDFDMVIAGYIIRIRTNNNILNPRYLSEFLNFPSTKKFLRNIAKGAVNQANINAKELQDISIPLAPLSLQNEFADFVAQVDKSQLAIQKSLDELETLKKSLMQEYFG